MLILTPAVAVAFAICADAQPLESIKSQQDLTKVITALDAALFDSYNHCDIEKFASFFTSDVEFYHDLSGLETGKQKLSRQINHCR